MFDILQDGFHTPLTGEQVAELFRAGRLSRKTPCKPATQREWRTIDELFPLLKYHSPWGLGYQSTESANEFRFRRLIVAATVLVGAAVVGVLIYLYSGSQQPRDVVHDPGGQAFRQITAIDVAPAPVPPRHATQIRTPFSANNPSPVVVVAPPVEPVNNHSALRLAEQQRAAEQSRLNQIRAEKDRAARERLLLEQEKAAGTDIHLPLDQSCAVNVGGESVTVKVQDNDVTSFDVWINGRWYHEVKKEKGISHSQTDETLIYSNGRASLYYVWEISGRINHCLLRVRDR